MAGSSAPRSSNRVVASIFFGSFWGFFGFAVLKSGRQTLSIWKRTKSIWNLYLWMIWIEVLVNLAFAVLTYLFVHEVVAGSFGYFFGSVVLWAIQTQILPQIIANRIGLVMVDRKKSRMIKWVLFAIIFGIQVSVFCIWIPALMEVSQTYIKLNYIWERVEKSLFLLIDLVLNGYFLHLVRRNLIMKGLKKYWPLFNFNVCAICLSVAIDGLLLGLLSLPEPYDYIQFAPVAYIVKLNIELTMAELISKVVRSGQRGQNQYSSSDPSDPSHGTALTSIHKMQQNHHYFPDSHQPSGSRVHRERPRSNLDKNGGGDYHGDGIMKTVTVHMNADSDRDEDSSTKTMVSHKYPGRED